jgi:glycosyltransferase involved in cell wall biosynthesis
MGNKRIANITGLSLIPLCRIFGLKVVTTFHHLDIKLEDLDKLGMKKSLFNKLGLAFGYFLVFRSNIVVSHVKISSQKPRNFFYIPHGTNLQRPISPEENSSSTILFFGALSPYKGVEYLIKAFKKLKDPHLKLLITDSTHPRFPKYSNTLRAASKSDHRITFVDYISEEDLPCFFSKGRIAVLPYISNTGTSGAFHTISSFGKATIMSNLSMFRTLIEEGAAGILVPPKDAGSLAKCLKQLISNQKLVQEIGAKNLAFAKSRTWNFVARQYLQVYSKMLAK